MKKIYADDYNILPGREVAAQLNALLAALAVGGRGEDSCFENSSDDILISMLNNNGTHVFVGHDHANNFIADYNNMKIGYATKSSYNCYFKSKVTGGTLLTVPASGDVKEEVILFR